MNHQFAYNNKKTFTMYKCKVSPSRRLKNILKPLLGRVFKTKTPQTKRSSYIASEEKEAEFDWLHNDMDNMANEHLENQLIDEIQQCSADDAIIIYGENGSAELQPMDPEDYYVPVNFARTNAGTFFWTSLHPKSFEPYAIEWNFLDRWGQA
ncbi:enhancer of split malpha protein [Scaptodrosophila lebanonensis]|uniref:Enhancer of split malpha protein n=1 Tax=Drosophila lebanonensis TaxID=7225 RepID=A0A6J2TJJ8_DROLE|nr:enhancer of split malpha protein [Scaptodrosophila lebanonensis]